MSKKEKVLSLLRANNISRMYTTQGFDFEEKHPSGWILIPGEKNYSLLNKLDAMYITEESLDNGQSLVVSMWPMNSEMFSRIRIKCTEVHDAYL